MEKYLALVHLRSDSSEYKIHFTGSTVTLYKIRKEQEGEILVDCGQKPLPGDDD